MLKTMFPLALAIGLVAGSAAATTPVIMDSGAHAGWAGFTGQGNSSLDRIDFAAGETLRDMNSAGNYAKIFDTSYITGTAHVAATSLSADAGHVRFEQQLGLVTDHEGTTVYATSDWGYSFVADQDGVFEFDYAAFGEGNAADLGYLYIHAWEFIPGQNVPPLFHEDHYDNDNLSRQVSGSLALLAGHYYIFYIDTGGEFIAAGPGGLSGKNTGDLDWRIVAAPPSPSPAPEPATWALMIVGFGMAGATLRQRGPTTA